MSFLSTHHREILPGSRSSNAGLVLGGGQEIKAPTGFGSDGRALDPSTLGTPVVAVQPLGPSEFAGPVLGYDVYFASEDEAVGGGSGSTSTSSSSSSSSWFFGSTTTSTPLQPPPTKNQPAKDWSFVSADVHQPTTTSTNSTSTKTLSKLSQSSPLFAADAASADAKVAYAGLVFLLLRHMRIKAMANASLGSAAIANFDRWATAIQERLFEFANVSVQEKTMIENLALHGVLPKDLARSLVEDSERSFKKAASSSSSSPSSTPTPTTSSSFTSKEKDIRFTVLAHLYILSIANGCYDSYSRTLIRQVALSLLVDWHSVSALEDAISTQLKLRELDASSSTANIDSMRKERNEKEAGGRWIYAGLATLAGGAVIGVTAGLAAPLIASGITAAVSSISGSIGVGAAGITTLMGTTTGIALITGSGAGIGGGLAGYKMMKRTKGIKEFEFVAMEQAKQDIRIAKGQCRREERRKRKIEEKKRRNGDSVKEPVPTPGPAFNTTGFVTAGSTLPTFASTAAGINTTHRRGSVISIASEVSTNSSILDEDPTNSITTSEKGPHPNKSSVLITIAGWVSAQDSRTDFSLPFSTITPGVHGDHFSLVWETSDLVELGAAVKLLKSEVSSFVLCQGVQYFLLPVLMAGLTTPMWLMKLTYMVDNPWGNGLTKARKAGKVLADTLMSRVQGNRPVTLVGYSLGARVIYYCLLELSTRGEEAFSLVEEAYLFGCPVMATTKEWRAISSVVSGRLVNGYMTNDWVLSILYRASSAMFSDVCGLNPVKGVVGVENVCLDGLLTGGHLEYRSAMPKILKYVGFSVDKDAFDDYRANVAATTVKDEEKEVLIVAREEDVVKADDGKTVKRAQVVKDAPVTRSIKEEYEEMKKDDVAVRKALAMAQIAIQEEKEKQTPKKSTSWFGFGSTQKLPDRSNNWL
ncbi:hypothetical protein HDU99_009188 [Rhizoclosmatium hyalinum]|nr:hypothetical protein HDU99_009188 [Rhizoclosmatium hyalinum]